MRQQAIHTSLSVTEPNATCNTASVTAPTAFPFLRCTCTSSGAVDNGGHSHCTPNRLSVLASFWPNRPSTTSIFMNWNELCPAGTMHGRPYRLAIASRYLGRILMQSACRRMPYGPRYRLLKLTLDFVKIQELCICCHCVRYEGQELLPTHARRCSRDRKRYKTFCSGNK